MTLENQTIRLYADNGWKKWFAAWRFWVAPYAYVETLVPKSGTIMELGCGEGLFSNYLALSEKKRKILGVELDKERVKIADKGLKNAKFVVGDALKTHISKLDCVVLFHVLHHLKSKESQEQLLKKIKKSLKPNGSIIIVEIENDASPKYYITWFWDHFMVPWFFEKSLYQKDIIFRTNNEWKELFRKLQLTTKAKKYDDNMPFSHIVYVCTSKK